jgi:hypothetical protein
MNSIDFIINLVCLLNAETIPQPIVVFKRIESICQVRIGLYPGG